MLASILLVPPPTSVTVTSIPISPIRPVGSAVTVTCTVELGSVVDIPVTVTTEWTGPAGFMITNIAQPDGESINAYTSTVMISSFGRSESGVYNCAATISSASLNSLFTDSMATTSFIRVTVGKLFYCKYPFLPKILMYWINACSHCFNFDLLCFTSLIQKGYTYHLTGQSMLTKVSSRSLRLGRLILKMKESNASLTGSLVVGMLSSVLESGFFPMGLIFQRKKMLQCFTETEEMMEVSV